MKKIKIIDLIKVDEFSLTPKYLQISNSIIRQIENGNIQAGDNLPSINELSIELDISRDTVERGYKHLKSYGTIDSVPKSGYFIKKIENSIPLKIFLLFNKLSEYKKRIYDSFFSTLGTYSVIDLYIYNNDFSLFKLLLSNKKNDYTHYVIIPHFIDGGEKAYEVINAIPKNKLLLLDKLVDNITGEYAAVFEDFENDLYKALTDALERLSKYHTLKFVFPRNSYYPSEILIGFEKFCKDYAFSYKVISEIDAEQVSKGEVYINVMENDLISLIEKILLTELIVGEDVGIISYGEVPLKKVILKGITTVSPDFKEMGKIAAELILSGSKEHITTPFQLILRNSL